MRKKILTLLCFLILLFGLSQEVRAQNGVGQLLKDTAKDVALDPTTYGPAGVTSFGKQKDWDSSQIFFQNGYIENNPDFTANGLPYDKPVSYAAGNREVIKLSLPVLELSAVNNVAISISQRTLIRSYPNHKKLIKSIGWIEKIAMASYLSYKYSHNNFRQWQTNNELAQQLNYK